jgi:hydroxymethylpyrimidine/phosphomethylpyrimidine kinase
MSDEAQATPDRTPVALAIAGSDSGGGAGIQADLKAFAAAGVHGTTAITALTAQNTVGVGAIEAVSPAMIVAQVQAVVGDIGVDAVKIGMLGTAETIAAVREALRAVPAGTPIVLDPVMVAESGAPLLEDDARRALVDRLLPVASVVTPNLQEARALTGLGESAGAAELAGAMRALGPAAAIVTGGHGPDGADLLDDGSGKPLRIAGPVHPDGAAHGSGCTHSSTVAALLARGLDLREAARRAREAAARSIAAGLRELGAGAGPVDVIDLRRRRARDG